MNKKDFEKIFKKGFNKQKIYYEDAQKNKSELQCFKCGKQAGIKTSGVFRKKSQIECINEEPHTETLLKYTIQYIEMEHDLLYCKLNENCQKAIKKDY